MENNEQKQKNTLGLVGFIISVAMAASLPIIMFIAGDMSKTGQQHLGFDIAMVLYFVPFAICMSATKRKPKGFAVAGTIISIAIILLMVVFRFVL